LLFQKSVQKLTNAPAEMRKKPGYPKTEKDWGFISKKTTSKKGYNKHVLGKNGSPHTGGLLPQLGIKFRIKNGTTTDQVSTFKQKNLWRGGGDKTGTAGETNNDKVVNESRSHELVGPDGESAQALAVSLKDKKHKTTSLQEERQKGEQLTVGLDPGGHAVESTLLQSPRGRCRQLDHTKKNRKERR